MKQLCTCHVFGISCSYCRWHHNFCRTVHLNFQLYIYTKHSYYRRTARCTESVSSNLVKRCTTVGTTCTTHTHPFNSPLSRTTRVSRYQKGKTNLDFTEARDSEWQWHQLGYMQVYTLLQTDNHASNPQLGFYRLDALPATKPTASKHWRDSNLYNTSRTIRSNGVRRLQSTHLQQTVCVQQATTRRLS